MSPDLIAGLVALAATFAFLVGNGLLWWGARFRPAIAAGLTMLGGACVFHAAVAVLLLSLPI